MKQKIISALFLSGTMLVSNFAFAESVPETATTTTVTESVAAATEESEPTKWEKFWKNCLSSPAIFKPAGTTTQ